MYTNNKRIAKNTLLLYFRMLLIMGVSLYTVRIVLSTLGAVDYGLYNVVGGIVVMFSFLSNTLASASQRFFAFELGKKNYDQLKKTFSMTMTIYGIIGVLILVLAETVGLWFVNTQMTIPAGRLEAANWVYQFAILSFLIKMITVPYNAAIIAHERMDVFAFVSILEAVLKLLIVYLLVLVSYDKLKLYALLWFCVTVLISLTYRWYCKKEFKECRYSFCWDKPLFKELMSYSGWNLFGVISSIFKDQGLNILLNIFFGPGVNAARAIAYQVNAAIANFGNNFFTAVRPQIIKSYANQKDKKMMKLVFQSSKFAFCLLLLLASPFLLETDFIIGLWLEVIPEYSIIFIQLVVIDMLIESLAIPIVTLAHASGRIKWYQIIVGGTRLLNLPIAFFYIKNGYPPETVFYIMIIVTILCNIVRLIVVKNLVNFNIMAYMKEVVLLLAIITIVSILISKFVQINLVAPPHLRAIIVILVSMLSVSITTYFIGLTKREKESIIQIITNKLRI